MSAFSRRLPPLAHFVGSVALVAALCMIVGTTCATVTGNHKISYPTPFVIIYFSVAVLGVGVCLVQLATSAGFTSKDEIMVAVAGALSRLLRRSGVVTRAVLVALWLGAVALTTHEIWRLIAATGTFPDEQISQWLQFHDAPPVADSYIRGRLVVLDRSRRSVSSVMRALPSQLCARAASEVQTVVYLNYEDTVVGRYSDGSEAIRRAIEVEVVDLTAPQAVTTLTATILGSEPPSTLKRPAGPARPVYGSNADEAEIVQLLLSLPRR